jgi:hypothetical protein
MSNTNKNKKQKAISAREERSQNRHRPTPRNPAQGGMIREERMPPLELTMHATNRANYTRASSIDTEEEPGSQNRAGLDDSTKMMAVIELQKQDQENRQQWVTADILVVMKFNCRKLLRTIKFPYANPVTSRKTDEFAKMVTKLPEQEFRKLQPQLRKVVNTFARSKRGTWTERMRDEFIGTAMPCFLLVNVACPFRKLTNSSGKELMNQECTKVDYTRYDFLCIVVDASIRTPANQTVYDKLQSEHVANKIPEERDEIEVSWERWKLYPNFPPHDSVRYGKGLNIIVWVIHTFVYLFIEDERRKSYLELVETWEPTTIEWISPDLFAFMILTLQHSINRWRSGLVYIEKERMQSGNDDFGFRDIPKDVVNKLPGREFEHGKGISGNAGQNRYRSLMKFWHLNYSKVNGSNSEDVKANISALGTELKKLVAKEREDAQAGMDEEDSTHNNEATKKKRKRSLPQAPQDDVFEEILDVGWSGLMAPVSQVTAAV